MDRASRKGIYIMLGLGLLLTLVGLVMISGDRRLADIGVRAEGVVTDSRRVGQSSQAIVTFTDEAGTTRSFNAGQSLAQGERVEVFYDPADPQLARIDRFSITPYAFLTFGLVFAGLGIATIIKLRRARQS